MRDSAREERQQVEGEAAELREAASAGERRRAEFGLLMDAETARLFEAAAKKADARVRTICDGIAGQQLHRDNTYGEELTAAMSKVGADLADGIVAAAERLAPAHGLGAMRSQAVQQLRKLLRTGPTAVEVPQKSLAVGAAAGVGTAGAVLGAALGPVGIAVGIGLGAGVGRALAKRQLERHRAIVVENLVTAGREAIARLKAQRGQAHRLVVHPDSTPPLLPDPPDESRLRALEALHEHLAGSLLPALDQARNATLARVT